jgi:hypothetical protein
MPVLGVVWCAGIRAGNSRIRALDGRLRLRRRFGYTSQSANPCKERASSP